MTNTYEVDDVNGIIKETSTEQNTRTYQKQNLIDTIARYNTLLSKFK